MEAKEILSNEEFQNSVEKGVTLVDFNAPWCAPCRSQEPIIKELAAKFEGKALIATLNIDENQDLAIKLGIRSVPTLVIFKNAKEIQRFVGMQSENTLSEALEKALK